MDPELIASGNALHVKLMQGDLTAPALIAEKILPVVLVRLRDRKALKKCDEPILNDAVCDAYFDYLNNPDQFDPQRSSLVGYLDMAAHRNTLNTMRDEKTRIKYEKSVELQLTGGNIPVDEEIASREEHEKLLSQIPGNTLAQKIAALISDPVDQQICRLMLDGERETEVFLQVAGLEVGNEDGARVVKRRKDKIKKILQRAKDGLSNG